MADKPLTQIYKDIKTAEEGKLFKSFGKAERLTGETKAGTLRKRAAARSASIGVRIEKTLRGEHSPAAMEARIRQKAAMKGVIVPKPPARPLPVGVELPRQAASDVEKLAKIVGRVGKVGKLLGIAGLPLQYFEFREAMKQPKLHEIERQASARRM